MLEYVKIAMRITVDAYDLELRVLIQAAKMDLSIGGVEPDDGDELVRRAIVTYCRMHFGSPPDYDRLEQSYKWQKAQLMYASGYTNWGDGHGA